MFQALAALAMTAVVAATPTKEPPHKTLVVLLIHRCRPSSGCLPGRILASMKNEAERIWSLLDVRLAWIDSIETAEAAHPTGLTVMLEEATYTQQAPGRDFVLAALTQPPATCGWGVAHVWIRQIERHAASVRGEDRASMTLPAALADVFLERALGRTLAHEIGHYLLGTREHALHGLMRAQFAPQDLLADVIQPLYGLDSRARAALIPCRTHQDAAPEGAR